jgi:3,4-dihydroxy-2-butanone 4-phosphate synthase
MVEQNQDARRTAFTVSVDLAHGITTGVSAQERTSTIRALGSQQVATLISLDQDTYFLSLPSMAA